LTYQRLIDVAAEICNECTCNELDGQVVDEVAVDSDGDELPVLEDVSDSDND
jgi:hypothetical protein